MKWIKRISIVLVIVAMPLCLSAYRAKIVADEIIKPAKGEIMFDAICFSRSSYFSTLDPPEKYTNNWRVSYCPKDEFC
jgi:hypothetical protein